MSRNSPKIEIVEQRSVRGISLIIATASSIVAIACVISLLELRPQLLDRQMRSRRARIAAEELSSTLQIAIDAETAVRGHVLRSTLRSSNPKTNFLEPFEGAVKRLPNNLSKIQKLIADDSTQQARYLTLKRFSYERIALLSKLVQTFAQLDENALSVQLDVEKHKMDELRNLQKVMLLTEQRKLADGIKRYAALQARQATVVNVVGVCVSVIFAIVGQEIYLRLQQETQRTKQAQMDAESAYGEVQTLENTAQIRAKTAAKIAHDIKHWLQPIQSNVEMLEFYRMRYPERIPKWIEKIKTGIAAIDRLAKDTVLVFQADTGELNVDREPTNLSQLLTDAIEDFQDRKHHISFSLIGTPSVVLIDRVLIDRAIRNLLNNACKYSPQGRQIYVALEFGDMIVVSVADQGIGIPEDTRKSLFQAFQRAENVGGIPGSGLGLAVVRAAAIIHGGDVSVDSREGLKIDGVEETFRTIFKFAIAHK